MAVEANDQVDLFAWVAVCCVRQYKPASCARQHNYCSIETGLTDQTNSAKIRH